MLCAFRKNEVQIAEIVKGTVIEAGNYADEDLAFYEAIKKALDWVCKGKGE